ncbi:MAG TPA: hypothetical protein VMT20_15665 [Terriglobia bacterium]|nr:hypothetical protein [Terriglobia bacterium]
MRTGLSLFLIPFPALSLPALASVPEQVPSAQLASLATLEGKLIITEGEGLRLATPGGDIAVTSDNPQLLHTLQDTRLAGRQVKLEGRRKPDGAFNASQIVVVRDGKLYRLRYYCHVCNIPATEPGPCVCCQRPTELEEIPADQVTKDMVLVP